MATHSRSLAWRISWREEPDGLQSIGSQRLGHGWRDLAHRIQQRECHLKKTIGMLSHLLSYYFLIALEWKINILSGAIIQVNNQVETIIGIKLGQDTDMHLYLSFCINFHAISYCILMHYDHNINDYIKEISKFHSYSGLFASSFLSPPH